LEVYITAILGLLVRINLYPFAVKILGDCITTKSDPNYSFGFYFDLVAATDSGLFSQRHIIQRLSNHQLGSASDEIFFEYPEIFDG